VSGKLWPALCCVALALAPAPGHAEQPSGVPASGVDARLGAALPLATEFTTSEGRTVALGDVIGRGKPALLVLAYSRCSMLCSLVLRATADLVPALGLRLGEDYSLVTISIDPRETPFEAGRTQAVTLARAGEPGANSDWPFLVGEPAAIAAVADSVGFRYQWDERSEQYSHPAVIYAISGAGRVEGWFFSLRPEPERVRAALAGDGTASDSLGAAVLGCFRFDALGRTYGPLVQRLFQGGALLVLGALATGLVILLRRERRAGKAAL
jgi:protein SCO1/2